VDPRAIGVNAARALTSSSRPALQGLLLSALLGTGCFSTPTPLAPGLHGTVGVPNRGVLTESEELPVQGEGFVRYRPQSSHYFGRPRLVSALEQAAQDVARQVPGGAPLAIGDLSAKGGGRIPGHDSHRSGRDVDLLFLVTTPEGVPVASPGFVRFEGDGLARVQGSGDFVRLDVDRQWRLLRSLLTSAEIGVQFMFVCHEVEALLIDHARALGEPDALIWHAETVMLEPSDSLRHDDHVHLRIACSPDEAVAGCSGGGPHWQWLPEYGPAHALDAQDFRAIAEEDPLEAQAADSANIASQEAREP
jgi:penicillin-insensitive murein endopeptidase